MKGFAHLQAFRKRSASKLCVFFGSLGFIALSLLQSGNAVSAQTEEFEADDPSTLIERLSKTNLLNGIEIYDQLELLPIRRHPGPSFDSEPLRVFITTNPYEPHYQHSFERFEDIENRLPRNSRSFEVDESKGQFTFFGQEPVLRWYASKPTNAQVCAVRFTDTQLIDYQLRTFSNSDEAINHDYVITHRYHCGTCSSLRNLAVYMAKPDLTTRARSCARRLTLRSIKKCLLESIGFEELCAETWAFNVAHTKRHCMSTCIKHYGFWRVMRNDTGEAHVDNNGKLNPCLACDEYISGPGFQYTAGRTRRASGLTSAINRPIAEIYSVDHSLYFK